MKPSRLDLGWATRSKERLAVALLVWIAAHAILVKGVVIGRLGFFSEAREPLIFWSDVFITGACLLAIDFALVCRCFGAKREKPSPPPAPPAPGPS